MNVQIHIQILLGYLQPVHLGLAHHQPSLQTSLLCVLRKKEKKNKDACLLACDRARESRLIECIWHVVKH